MTGISFSHLTAQQKLAKTANTDKKLSYHKETLPVCTMPAWFNYRA